MPQSLSLLWVLGSLIRESLLKTGFVNRYDFDGNKVFRLYRNFKTYFNKETKMQQLDVLFLLRIASRLNESWDWRDRMTHELVEA